MRRFVIRADAGEKVGFGHILRSLSLAKFLRTHYGIVAVFYSNPYKKLESTYRQNGFEYILNSGLSEIEFLNKIGDDAPGSIVFIDRLFPYGRDTIQNLRDRLKIIMFQNECEGMYECDYAVFPSAHLSDQMILSPQWSRARAKFLYGPDYVIINESVIAFLNQQRGAKPRPYIAITTGASDPEGILVRTLEWINESEIDVPVKALYGFDFCHRSELEFMFPKLKPSIEVREFNYDDLFSARLAISAFGVTTYELVYANIPVITIGHVQKNALGSEILQKRYGCNYHLGLFREVTREQLISAIQVLWNHEEKLAVIKRNQQGLIDGKGLERLGQIISCCYTS